MKKIWRHTWCYKTYDMVRSYIDYKKDKKAIKSIFYGQEFKIILKQYLNLDVRKDWVGRLYGVINPNINKEGFIDVTNSIIEIDDENTNSNTYAQVWVYKQLELIRNLFNIHRLYDYINVDIEHVGPLSQDNYLVVFDIASREESVITLKRWLKSSIFYILTFGILGLGYFLYF